MRSPSSLIHRLPRRTFSPVAVPRVVHAIVAVATLGLIPRAVRAQRLDLTVDHVGIAIGNIPRVTGLRLNFRDRGLEYVKGVNATIWSPYEPLSGRVDGLALGLPATGAARINGLGVGVFGVGARDEIQGIGIGGIGLGAGGNLTGIMLGGVGVGTGGRVDGIAAALVGVGSGAGLRGVMVGGIGVGGGGDVRGVAIGGIGVGGGGNLRGLVIGGVGVGVGGSVRGVTIGGIGVGAGGDVTGISIGGVGVGAGGTLKGLTIAGVGAGAPQLEGIVLTGVGAGALHAKAVVVAPFYFRIDSAGTFTGGSLSAYNHIEGRQHGLTIGLINYARALDGVQLGIINILDRPRGRRVTVLFNAASDP